jgi:hypothetical protein
LRLLAELGHLKSKDLLWRLGFGGWKSAESVPGVLAPAPLATVQSSTTQSLTAKISALFSPLLMQRWGMLVGFLIAALLGGSIDVAMRASATGTETSEKAVSLQAQVLQTVAPTVESAKVVQSSPISSNGLMTVQGPSNPKPESDPTQEGRMFSVSNIHPTDGFNSKPSPISLSPSEDSAESASLTNPDPGAQPDSDAKPDEPDATAQPDQSDAMPLPTRKPERPIAKEAARSKANRIAQRRGDQKPKPLRFGNIGYNYNAQ